VTNRGNTVVRITGTKTTVFSPDDVNGFVVAIRSVAPNPDAARDDQDSCSTQSSYRGALIEKSIGVVIGMLMILPVAGSSAIHIAFRRIDHSRQV
jgi:hypothetical protein